MKTIDTLRNNSIKTHWKLALVGLLSMSILSACVPALVAGAAIATIDIIHDRRTVGEYIDDNAIEITARNILVSNKELRKASRVKPVSWNGILLLTGEILDEANKQLVVGKMSNIRGVRQIVDETTISGKSGFGKRSRDAWISSKVKTKLISKTGLDANRVKVVTTNRSVYLMGIVTEDEAARATESARSIRGVERVVKVFEYRTT